MTKVIEYVSIILENYEGKLWISRRNNPDKIMYGKYQCSGGHIENKSRFNAVVRELHEETNLIPNHTLQFIFEYSFNIKNDIYDNGERVIYVYKMITDQIPQNTKPEKHSDWKLYTKKELETLPIIDTFKEYLSQNNKQKIFKLLFLLFKEINIAEYLDILTIMKLRYASKQFKYHFDQWIYPLQVSA